MRRFLGTATGAMMAIADPSGRRPFAASRRRGWGEGHAPVVAVLCGQGMDVGKARRVHCGPQRARTPDPASCFPCKTGIFRGPPEGAMIAIVDPMQPDAVMVGEGHAPVVAGSPALRRSYNKRLQGKA
jgi:hypothetical protein